jgi:hypothetical protein
MALDPTDVAYELATSFAPMPNAAANARKPAQTMSHYDGRRCSTCVKGFLVGGGGVPGDVEGL